MKFILVMILSVVALLSESSLLTAQNTVSGYVFNRETKESLPGATIFIPHTQSGSVTDIQGFFTLSSSLPIDSLSVYYIGYEAITIAVTKPFLQIGLQASVQNLQTLIVTANRGIQERKEIPAAVNSISAQTIQETNPTQLNQVLNKIPGLIMKDLNSEQHSMAIRQPMTTRPYFLYLEDGLPIAPVGNFNHHQLIEVNMLGIRKIEVVKGPASSIYGSNAIGGAINFITQSPPVLPTAELGFQQNNTGYQRIEFFAGDYLKPKFGLSFGGYIAKQKNGWQSYSDFDKVSLSAKGVYQIDKKTLFTAYATSNFLDTETGGSIDSAGYYSRNYLANNNFSYRKVNALRGRLTLDRFHNKQSQTSISFYSGRSAIGQNPRYRIRNVDLLTAKGEENENRYMNYGSLIQHTQSFERISSKLIVGVAGNYAPTSYHSYFGSIARDSLSGYYTHFSKSDSLLADYHTDLAGLGTYLQYEINPIKQLKFVIGVRFDQLSYRYTNRLSEWAYSGVPDTTIINYAFSPKLGVTYDLGHFSGIYGSYSRGFSPPQTSDLFFGTKLPHLKPAYFTNYEIGGWAAFFDEKLYLDVALYRMMGENEIISFRLPDNSTESRNSGKTLHQGIEYSLAYQFSKNLFFRIGGTYSIHQYLDYKVQENAQGSLLDYSGKEMPEAPRTIWNAELSFKPSFLKGFSLSTEWQLIGSWYKNDSNTSRYNDRTFLLRGASYLNLRSRYRLKSVEIYCNITNLTNELYANSAIRGSNNKDTFAAGAPRTIAFGFIFNLDKKDSL